MSVKIAKLFKDSTFVRLPKDAKLLYIYLATHPDLSVVGVFSPNIEVCKIESGLIANSFKHYSKILVQQGFIHVKKYNDTVYFIVPAHFNNIPKSTTTVTRVNKALNELPVELVEYLATIGITINSKIREFVKPTAQEVTNYGIEQGHKIDGEAFISYYEEQADIYGKKNIWVDSRGTEVRDWKAKLRRIWCKDDNLIKVIDGAPKGFEDFYVVSKDGKNIYPDKWTKEGLPWSKNVGSDILLKREFKRQKS